MKIKFDFRLLVPQDPAEVATLIELKVLSDLFIPPVPSHNDKGNTQYTRRRHFSFHVFWLIIAISSFIASSLSHHEETQNKPKLNKL